VTNAFTSRNRDGPLDIGAILVKSTDNCRVIALDANHEDDGWKIRRSQFPFVVWKLGRASMNFLSNI
jgi:hypothetical protein